MCNLNHNINKPVAQAIITVRGVPTTAAALAETKKYYDRNTCQTCGTWHQHTQSVDVRQCCECGAWLCEDCIVHTCECNRPLCVECWLASAPCQPDDGPDEPVNAEIEGYESLEHTCSFDPIDILALMDARVRP